jgi:hypothetical protein
VDGLGAARGVFVRFPSGRIVLILELAHANEAPGVTHGHYSQPGALSPTPERVVLVNPRAIVRCFTASWSRLDLNVGAFTVPSAAPAHWCRRMDRRELVTDGLRERTQHTSSSDRLFQDPQSVNPAAHFESEAGDHNEWYVVIV